MDPLARRRAARRAPPRAVRRRTSRYPPRPGRGARQRRPRRPPQAAGPDSPGPPESFAFEEQLDQRRADHDEHQAGEHHGGDRSGDDVRRTTTSSSTTVPSAPHNSRRKPGPCCQSRTRSHRQPAVRHARSALRSARARSLSRSPGAFAAGRFALAARATARCLLTARRPGSPASCATRPRPRHRTSPDGTASR